MTLDAGTGCVHIAPGHGQDDYEIGLKHGLDIYNPVDGQASSPLTSRVPEASSYSRRTTDNRTAQTTARSSLRKIRHSYPHCWRCKSYHIQGHGAVVRLDGGRRSEEKALKAIENDVKWIPSWGRERIYNMILNRPDWCLSRQRAWGVPIPALRCTGCGESFLDVRLIDSLVTAFEKEGADVWFEKDLKDLLPDGVRCPKCASDSFEKEDDILDVWFDSGVSFAAVVEKRENLQFPADLYLEGSDQHRGWFHSSLLACEGTRSVAPYKAYSRMGSS